jgi:hypothetical protein
MTLPIGDISQIIQLAIAPVFLLAGVGTKLVVLTNRLARIIDRLRVLDDYLHGAATSRSEEYLSEMTVLYLRRTWINRAITQSTLCGLLICMVVASLFIGSAFSLPIAPWIEAMFVLAMLALIGSFLCFLREIVISGYHRTPLPPTIPPADGAQ